MFDNLMFGKQLKKVMGTVCNFLFDGVEKLKQALPVDMEYRKCFTIFVEFVLFYLGTYFHYFLPT